MTRNTTASKSRFCTECGTQFLPDALFCHNCGATVEGRAVSAGPTPTLSPMLRWGVPVAAVGALIVLTFFRLGSGNTASESAPVTPLTGGAMRAPDISSMSPSERADRLFNRVMSLSSEGKTDSATFFAPMAIAAFEALAPLNAHTRYDLGLVALVSGDVGRAAAQSDSILLERPTHLLGLALAARVAEARGDSAAGRAARQRLLAAEKAERAAALPEYNDHDADLRAAIEQARKL
jgi:zinc ribbon protein